MSIEILFITLILIHIILNILFTFAILKRNLYTAFQNCLYISVVWLLPIIGLIWMWIILTSYKEKGEVDNSNALSGPDFLD